MITGRFRLCLGLDGLIPQVPRLPVVPVLLEFCRALSMLAAQRCTRISVPLGADCRFILEWDRTVRATVLASGQAVVRDQHIELTPLVESVLRTARAFLQTMQAGTPTLAQTALAQTLQAAMDGLAGLPTVPARPAPLPAPAPEPAPRQGVAFAQLEDDRLRVRIGRSQLTLDGCSMPVTAAALVALVRQAIVTRDWPIGQQTVPIDAHGLHVFLLARTPTGMALTVLDAGQCPLCAAVHVSLADLARAGWQCVQALPPTYAEYHQTLAQLLRWTRAIERPPQRRVPTPPDWQPPIFEDPPVQDPLPVAGLHHLAYRRSWRIEALGLLRVSATHGRLLVHDRTGLRAVDPGDAETIWHLPDVRPLTHAPPEIGVDARGGLVAFDGRTGQARWRCEVDEEQPVVSVVPGADHHVAQTDSTLFGIDGQGRRRWRYDSWYGRVSRPVLHGMLCWCIAEDGFLHAIRMADGARQFAVAVTGEPDSTLALTETGVLVPTTIEPSGRGALSMYGHVDGRLRWRVKCEGAFAEPPRAHDGSVYALLRDGDRLVLEARRLSDGVLRWRHSGLAPGPLARLHPVGDLLCLKSAAGEVLAIETRDGGPRWRLMPDDTDEALISNAPPVARRGILLVPGAAIRVLDPRSGRLIQVLDCGELTPDWLHVWPDGNLAIAEDEAVVRYTLGGHLALVR